MKEKSEKVVRIARNVVLLGLVSFFADLSSEMVYPLIPIYLTTILGATPAIVGVIEGIAESLASLLKVYSGHIADKFDRKKPLALAGYSTGLIYKIALIFANSWIGILIARIVDRFGKGIRTAPRDVMIAQAGGKKQGKTFGFHKMLDMLGSAIGIMISFILFKTVKQDIYKVVFLVSMIPMVISLVFFFFIHEDKREKVVLDDKINKEEKVKLKKEKKDNIFKRFKTLDRNLKLYLLVTFIFALGNSSNSLLLLKAQDFGFDSTNILLMYFLYNIIASLLAIPFGMLSDKKGRKWILVIGYLLYGVVYYNFAFCKNIVLFISGFVVYGIYLAMVSGVERAFISEISPSDMKGTMLGLHGTLVGIALLPASAIAGLLWDVAGPAFAFSYSATLSIVAAIILIFFIKDKRKETSTELKSL